MDLDTLDWDEDIARRDGHPARDAAGDPLVRARSTATARERGALAGVPVAGDPRRPARGDLRPGLLRPGEAKNTYGTGYFLLLNTGAEPMPSASTVC